MRRLITVVTVVCAATMLLPELAAASDVEIDAPSAERSIEDARSGLEKAQTSLTVLDLRESERTSLAAALSAVSEEIDDVALLLEAGAKGHKDGVVLDATTWTREAGEVADALRTLDVTIDATGLASADRAVLDRHVNVAVRELTGLDVAHVVGGKAAGGSVAGTATSGDVLIAGKRFQKSMKKARKAIANAERDLDQLDLKRKQRKRAVRYLGEIDAAIGDAVALVDGGARAGKGKRGVRVDLEAWWQACALIRHETAEFDRLRQRWVAKGIDTTAVDNDFDKLAGAVKGLFSEYALDAVDYDAMVDPNHAWETELPRDVVDGYSIPIEDERRAGSLGDPFGGGGVVVVTDHGHGHGHGHGALGVVAMDQAAFAILLATVEEQSFSSDRISTIEIAAGANAFDVAQVVALMEVLDFESDKVTAAIALYPTVVDPENWFMINGAFDFSSSADEVRGALGL